MRRRSEPSFLRIEAVMRQPVLDHVEKKAEDGFRPQHARAM